MRGASSRSAPWKTVPWKKTLWKRNDSVVDDLLAHLIVLAAAFGAVAGTTPLVRWAAWRTGAVAKPGERHIHTRSTPTLGGLAMFAGLLTAIIIASFLPAFSDLFRTTNEPEAIVLASFVVVVVGMIDDTRGLLAPAKLAGQILAAGTLVLFGLSLRFVYIPGGLGIVYLNPDLAALLTIAAIVAMMNAVNLTDGLDGLAAGIVAIAAGALFVYGQFADPMTVTGLPSSSSLVLAALVGSCLGFLIYNFHPATIFMGDTGALLLGLLLAAGGVSTIGNAVGPGRADFAAFSVPALIPALVLAVPFLDTAWTILRRLRNGRAIFSPDKRHLHHRLMEIGHSHRRAVLVMYYWSFLLAFVTVGLGLAPAPLMAIVVAVGLGGAVVIVTPRSPRWFARRTSGTGKAHGSMSPQPLVHPFTNSCRRPLNNGPEQQKHAETEV
jgi:UDP-GlcNAc:undecaprenyl-phosphate GlcNAc-1-phosphate transferase